MICIEKYEKSDFVFVSRGVDLWATHIAVTKTLIRLHLFSRLFFNVIATKDRTNSLNLIFNEKPITKHIFFMMMKEYNMKNLHLR